MHRISGELARPARRFLGPAAGLCGAVMLIGASSLGLGRGSTGAAWGLVIAVGFAAVLSRALRKADQRRLTPADRVTLCRGGLIVGVTALVAESFAARVPAAPLVVLAAAALVLDAVDGRVARRTGTVHELGARFDMEADALLILALSVFVAADVGWWVLAIGAAHYLLLAARRLWPWLRAPVPARYWCKVVAALQGVMLTVAASEVLPSGPTVLLLVASAALLAESFGRELWQLWQQRERPARQPGEVAVASREEFVAVDLGALPR